MPDFSTFDRVDWLVTIGLGSSAILNQLCRARAVHYEEPARLTVLNYFQSVIQLFTDVLFLGTDFSNL